MICMSSGNQVASKVLSDPGIGRAMYALAASTIVFLFSFLVFVPVLVASGPQREDREEAVSVLEARDFEPAFREAVALHSPWRGDEIEISNLRTFPARVPVPAGEMSIEVLSPPNVRTLGTVTVSVNVLVDGVIVRTVRVSGRVEVYRPVICALRALEKGSVIGPSDVALSRHPVSRLPGEFFSDPAEVVGKRITRSLPPGKVIGTKMLSDPVLVSKGASVIIIAESPVLRVSVPGQVLEDGQRGDFVRVMNIVSRKEVMARVEDGKTVSVVF